MTLINLYLKPKQKDGDLYVNKLSQYLQEKFAQPVLYRISNIYHFRNDPPRSVSQQTEFTLSNTMSQILIGLTVIYGLLAEFKKIKGILIGLQ